MAMHCFGSPRPAGDEAPPGAAHLTLQADDYGVGYSIDKHRELSMDTHLQVGENGPASRDPGSAAATATGQ
jgi:hypothetical protein